MDGLVMMIVRMDFKHRGNGIGLGWVGKGVKGHCVNRLVVWV